VTLLNIYFVVHIFLRWKACNGTPATWVLCWAWEWALSPGPNDSGVKKGRFRRFVESLAPSVSTLKGGWRLCGAHFELELPSQFTHMISMKLVFFFLFIQLLIWNQLIERFSLFWNPGKKLHRAIPIEFLIRLLYLNYHSLISQFLGTNRY
jgi:hypothetical protein